MPPRLPPPPVLPRRLRESGVFAVERSPGPKVRLREALKRQAPVRQPVSLRIPYRDDWKSPPWVFSYVVLAALMLWILTR